MTQRETLEQASVVFEKAWDVYSKAAGVFMDTRSDHGAGMPADLLLDDWTLDRLHLPQVRRPIAGHVYKSIDTGAEGYAEVLRAVRGDAQMALADQWDRTDEGFQAQIDMIDAVLIEETPDTGISTIPGIATLKHT